ncbi:hypothetical protein [Tumebacillus lipolyticus]|uniref:DUF2178 domain-containing protein n=1 Tax=Tumebacillus lipolyticus TaxID=1280370 RepID=A0ABW5A3C8_9BACL
MSSQVIGMLGLLLGLAGGAFGLFYGRYKARKERGLDERYDEISKRALAVGWKCSFAAMIVLFALVILGVLESAAAAIGIAYLVHLASASFAFVYYQLKL